MRQFLCRDRVVREETFDADAHFGESPGGVDARSNTEGEVARRSVGGIASGDFKKRVDARTGKAASHTIEALRDQDAVVVVKLHDIGDGSESNQIAQFIQTRLRGTVKNAAVSQFGAKRHENYKDISRDR